MVLKTAKGWAIFIYIFAPLLIALFVWLMLMPFSSEKEIDPVFYWLLWPVSLAMIAMSVIGVLDTIISRLIVGENSIKQTSTLSNRELKFSEIKGFKTDDKYVYVLPNRKGLKKLQVSKYFGNIHQFIGWLYNNFPNLDEENFEEEQTAILQNHEFGRNEEERLQKLAEAKKVTSIINWAGGACLVWTLFYPEPYEWSVLVCMSFPVLCIFVLQFYKGLVRIDEKTGSAHPTLGYAIFLPTMSILLRAIFDYNILVYDNIWLPAGLVAMGLTVVLVISTGEFKLNKVVDVFTTLVVALCMFCYAYGSTVLLNCMYDTSASEHHTASILNKRTSSGRTTTYYLELTAWGPQTAADEVSVSKEFYNEVEIDQEVNVYLQEGKFNIPWFEVTE